MTYKAAFELLVDKSLFEANPKFEDNLFHYFKSYKKFKHLTFMTDDSMDTVSVNFTINGTNDQFTYKLSNILKKDTPDALKTVHTQCDVFLYDKTFETLTYQCGIVTYINYRFQWFFKQTLDCTDTLSDNLLMHSGLSGGCKSYQSNLRYKLYAMYPKIKHLLKTDVGRVAFMNQIMKNIQTHPKTKGFITFEHARDPEFLLHIYNNN